MRISAKYLLLLKIICFSPILLLIVTVNYIADPAHLFTGGRYEKGMVEIILAGKNIANVDNFNDRRFQKIYADTITEKHDILVFGSSRAMQISSDMFPSQNLFNCGIPNGTIQDYFSIYQVYNERGLKPSVLILGLDPWIFNRNSSITRWRELESEYFAAFETVTGEKSGKWLKRQLISQKYQMLFSFSYFQRSIRVLTSPEKRNYSYYPTDDTVSDVAIKLTDGSLSVDEKTRNRTPEEVRIQAQKRVTDYRVADFNELDPFLTQSFEAFINSLQADNVRLVFYIPPYHPATYEQICESIQHRAICDTEIYLRDLATKKGIITVGSYDPEKCGCDDTDFYDQTHAKRETVEEIFKREYKYQK